jgi:hypothetical protein
MDKEIVQKRLETAFFGKKKDQSNPKDFIKDKNVIHNEKGTHLLSKDGSKMIRFQYNIRVKGRAITSNYILATEKDKFFTYNLNDQKWKNIKSNYSDYPDLPFEYAAFKFLGKNYFSKERILKEIENTLGLLIEKNIKREPKELNSETREYFEWYLKAIKEMKTGINTKSWLSDFDQAVRDYGRKN